MDNAYVYTLPTNDTIFSIVYPEPELKLNTLPLPPVKESVVKIAFPPLFDDINPDIKFINSLLLYDESPEHKLQRISYFNRPLWFNHKNIK